MRSEPDSPDVVPRTVPDEHARLSSLFPGLDADRIVVVEDGWDNVVLDVDDRWIVIDWTAARIDDPASERAWFCTATPPAFADALVDANDGVDDAFRDRARRRGALIAWYEVAHGAEQGLPDLVASGLKAVREGLSGA